MSDAARSGSTTILPGRLLAPPEDIIRFEAAVPDMSRGTPLLEDILAALEWQTNLLSLVQEANCGDIVLIDLGVGFVSLTEALDLTTPSGRAIAGMLAVFAEFEREIIRERVRAGRAQARAEGKVLGQPPSAAKKEKEVNRLFAKGLSKSEIARRIGIGRTSVRRLLA